MTRIVVSLTEDETAWLDRTATRRGVSMTEIIREAIRGMRAAAGAESPELTDLLARTRGLWSGPDGLAWQEQLRDGW